MKRRALLLSGGISEERDRPFYANNIAAYYRLLTDVYGYDEHDIRVCLGRGGTYPLAADGSLRSVVRAKPSQVLDALRFLAELGDEDQAVVMVTDHGDPELGVALWGKNLYLAPAEVEEILGPSKATKVLLLGQCSAGTFGSLDLGRAVVCCACGPGEYSHPCPRPAPDVEPTYDEFLYQLCGALAGSYPDGQPLLPNTLPPPPAVRVGAAFRYAHDHDRWITGTRAVSELPRMFDPGAIADEITL